MTPFQIIGLVVYAAQNAPQVLALLASLVQIFTPDDVDERIEAARNQAVAALETALRDARQFVRNVETLDFGKGPAGNKLERFEEVVRSIKTRAAAVGQQLGETDARTLAQNAVKLERSAAVIGE